MMIYIVKNSEGTLIGAFKQQVEAAKFRQWLADMNKDYYEVEYVDCYKNFEEAKTDYEQI